MTRKVSDVNIASQELLPTPQSMQELLPLTSAREDFVYQSRKKLQEILAGEDKRLIMVVGPCSIHDLDSAREYAKRLKELERELRQTFFIVMRVYFEKPRTVVGWKGFINDPYLNDSFRIDHGLQKAREFLIELSDLELPAGTEALDPITPQYLHDLISWTAIGARTTESQTHREMSSGLSTPVGFKNATDGDIQVAINAMRSASQPHHFLGISKEGQVAVMRTKGNAYSHVILRGGAQPNYDSVHVALCEQELTKSGLRKAIMIDCSHGNSMKNPALQPLVLENGINQILEGSTSIVGFMLESHLNAGNQSIPQDLSSMRYGVSVTDGCIDWGTTERCLRDAHNRLLTRK